MAKRLVLALAAYVALAALALPRCRIRKCGGVTLAILAMFAVKTWVRRKDVMHSGDEERRDELHVSWWFQLRAEAALDG